MDMDIYILAYVWREVLIMHGDKARLVKCNARKLGDTAPSLRQLLTSLTGPATAPLSVKDRMTALLRSVKTCLLHHGNSDNNSVQGYTTTI